MGSTAGLFTFFLFASIAFGVRLVVLGDYESIKFS